MLFFDTTVITGNKGAGLDELQQWIDRVSESAHDSVHTPSTNTYHAAIGSADRALGNPVVTLGFGICWKPKSATGIRNKVATLQLANKNMVIVIQLTRVLKEKKADAYLQILKAVLESPLYLKAGVGIVEDCRRLLCDWDLEVIGRVEINDVCHWIKPGKFLSNTNQ